MKALKFVAISLLVLSGSLIPAAAFAALPPGFEIETLASGMTLPTAITFTNDGRIFIAEKNGTILTYKDGKLLPNPLIRLTDVNDYGDRGLIGIAADPNFSQNGYLYLSYTHENTPGTNYSGSKTGHIARITVKGDIADESSKVILVGTVGGDINSPSCTNFPITADCITSDSSSHSVGGLRFGPDGKLYATLGEGASFDFVNANSLNAQNIDALGGKMLRINTDGTAPGDNPFYNGDANANRSKVYAYGLRHMYRFNFKPSGELFGGDVGWNNWEEVNKIVRGGNYGWPCREGGLPTVGYDCTAVNAIDPFYYYGHNSAGAGAVTSGAFPSGNAYPTEYANTFFFGDYAQNWIKQMKVSSISEFVGVTDFAGGADKTNGPVEFATGPEGNVYFIAIYQGELKRITHTLGNRQPVVLVAADQTAGYAPLSVNFSSTGTYDPDADPLTYLWSFGDNTTSADASPVHVYGSNGSYNAVLTVRDNRGGVQSKSILISVGNNVPMAIITSPKAGTFYNPGDTLMLSGSGKDLEDGNLPNSSLSWRVILHHNTHIHILETRAGNNITFTAPDHKDPSVYTEVELTATDSGGLTNTTSVNMYLNNAGSDSNIIINPSFEERDALYPTQPKGWLMDWWGNLDPVFTYPVLGYAGGTSSAAKLEIRTYNEGDAKWHSSPVFVEENISYSFSDHHVANVTTDVFAEFSFTNGTKQFVNLGTAPASLGWKDFNTTLTMPKGIRTVAILHILSSVGSLTIDDFSLVKLIPDGNRMAITSPIAGEILTGTVSMAAATSDNSNVAGVQFMVDDMPVGAMVATAPYSTSLDSSTLANGTHNISARTRNKDGNITSTNPVAVSVNNMSVTNLIKNPSFEISKDTLPIGWTRDAWGNNNTIFTYPVAGHTGANAAQLSVTSYQDGDIKWIPDDVSVIAGVTYTYSDWYKCDDISDVIGRYTMSDGSVQYIGVAKELLPTTQWAEARGIFIPPVGAVSITLFHLVSSIATLTIDDVSLTASSSEIIDIEHPDALVMNPIEGAILSGINDVNVKAIDNIGITSVLFLLDGVAVGPPHTAFPYTLSLDTRTYANGPHTISARAKDAAGNVGTAPIVNVTINNTGAGTGTNLIKNPSFENSDASGPTFWLQGSWGVNTPIFTHQSSGYNSQKSGKVQMTAYTDGDAKWYFAPMPVTSGKEYEFTDFYKADTDNSVTLEYTLADGTVVYEDLGASGLAANWTPFTAHFTPPVGAVSVTVYHAIAGVGTLSVDVYSLITL